MPECRHTFCIACLQHYIHWKVDNGDVEELTCPHESGGSKCTSLIHEDILRSIGCSNEDITKYRRFRLKAKYPDLFVDCPRCSHSFIAEESTSFLPWRVSPAAEVTCSKCEHTFCALHGDAHPGISCAVYTSSRFLDPTEAVSAIAVGQYTRRCPNPSCRAVTHKDSGCNHVTCSRCKTHFCWVCARKLADPGTHYELPVTAHFEPSVLNITGCPGLQMRDNVVRDMPNVLVGPAVWAWRGGRLVLLVALTPPVFVVGGAVVGCRALARVAGWRLRWIERQQEWQW